jgi:hypothetical protein
MLRTGTVALSLVVAIVATLAPQTRASSAVDVNSLGLDASYDVSATFDWHARTADVRTTATVRGSKPWATATLAFNLQTLRIGRAQLTLTTVNGRSVTPTIDDQTVLVPLDPPLAPGGSALVEIDYSGHLTATPDPNGDDWGFAATSDYLTGYRWIPWLSRTTPFDRPSVGDPYVTASASRVKVAISADPSLIFAATGVESSRSAGRHVFSADNVRDFNFSASPSYRLATRTVGGTEIRAYYRNLDPSLLLDVTARAFDDYSNKVGAYPYPQLSVAETGPWAAIESPMLFWLPDNAGRLLAWMTAHETAHQWFYSVVGNDQAREPFADEALADFMARNLLARFVPSQCNPGFLDQSIYDAANCYPWVVYVQGNLWLRDYRDAVGSATFWRGVANYYAAYRFKIGGTRQLLDALDAASAGVSRLHAEFPTLYAVPVISLPFGSVP